MTTVLYVVALLACGWTTTYAWTSTVPSLLWLDRVRREDAWWATIDGMFETLDALRELDSPQVEAVETLQWPDKPVIQLHELGAANLWLDPVLTPPVRVG